MGKNESYRKTLHLPQTDFPMKAGLFEKEPELIQSWNSRQIYQKMQKKRKTSEVFFLSDGPPYANGSIHIGHALNKILKDIVIKYKNLKGFKSPFVPSWDCHGLPIELKALQQNSQKERKTDKELRDICRETARFWIKKQKQSFQSLGILADWENHLLTMDSDYEAEEVRVFGKLVKKGYIYRGTKPVFWCFKLQTAIAFSEAEYREHKSPSIYVRFDLDIKSQNKLESKKKISAVIWTTTPWTLPANSAICLHPELEYGIYEGKTQSYLIACELAETFFKDTGLTSLKKQKSFKGKDLEGLTSIHPFLQRFSPFVLGDHVSIEAGTGLVHTAPGHGLEDYFVGEKYKLKKYCPVDGKGHFTKEVPESLRNLFIFKGNKKIIEILKDTKHLISFKEILHKYPYNPRSNSPLIYRLTPQWFLSLDKSFSKASLRSEAILACKEKIHFIPNWGQNRLLNMVQLSPDWCLSRQRQWGVPLVVFYCLDCKEPFLDSKNIEKIAKAMEQSREGIEYYFSRSEKELLPKDQSCLKCGSKSFQKGKDILDVWFDSGVQHAVLSKKGGPAFSQMFLEGSDQHRGWFQTSLFSSLALYERAPFEILLTHGFVNDNQGYKMSKSKGNVLDPETIVKNYGAEILRLWVASENYSLDIKAGKENFQRVAESYRRFRNSFRFILGNLKDFHPLKDSIEFVKLKSVDQWILIQLNGLIKEITKDFDEFTFHKVYQKLNHFFTIHLSAFYLDIIKDRLYTFPKYSLDRKQAQTVLYRLCENLISLMAPITSFLSEEVYSYLPNKHAESVFLEDFPKPFIEGNNKELENLFSKLFPIREALNKKLERLRRAGQIGTNLQAKASIYLEKDFISSRLSEAELLEFFGLSQLNIKEGQSFILEVEPAKGEKCLRCWFISENLNKENLCPKCVKNLLEK